MISQNIRFKPLQSHSKALSAASWLITPLISYGTSECIKTWL
nr:MAG TPA: Satellite RNA 48 kDa protein [Caudoviricetes sp.]